MGRSSYSVWHILLYFPNYLWKTHYMLISILDSMFIAMSRRNTEEE